MSASFSQNTCKMGGRRGRVMCGCAREEQDALKKNTFFPCQIFSPYSKDVSNSMDIFRIRMLMKRHIFSVRNRTMYTMEAQEENRREGDMWAQ